jgi:hypothetical protein
MIHGERNMKVQGRCHCGRIEYEGVVDPESVQACHCTDCQALTGSAYRVSIRAPAATFRLTRGTPKTYVKTTADSGTPRLHAFCGDCGSPVYATALDNPQNYTLRVGGLVQRALLPPKRQLWCRSALPWSTDLTSVPKVERQ